MYIDLLRFVEQISCDVLQVILRVGNTVPERERDVCVCVCVCVTDRTPPALSSILEQDTLYYNSQKWLRLGMTQLKLLTEKIEINQTNAQTNKTKYSNTFCRMSSIVGLLVTNNIDTLRLNTCIDLVRWRTVSGGCVTLGTK